MLLKKNCINNGVTNGLKQNKEKACQTALYDKIKERRETGGEWLIGARAQNVPFICSYTTQDKIKARKAPIDEARMRVRRKLMMEKAHRRVRRVSMIDYHHRTLQLVYSEYHNPMKNFFKLIRTFLSAN